MPLVDRNGGQRIRIEITHEIDPAIKPGEFEWYEIRGELGYFALQKLNQSQALTINVPYGKAESGDIDADEFVPVRMDHQAELNLDRFAAWLVAWSHKEPLNKRTIERIPFAHARLINAAIRDRERAMKGVSGPLETHSTSSLPDSIDTPISQDPSVGTIAEAAG